MRAMGGRPVLLQRFPDGAGGLVVLPEAGAQGPPDWLQTTIVSTPNGTTSQALVAADLAHVLWAVNLGCLGFHVWPYLAADPEHTDELRIDLDPHAGRRLPQIREAAHEVKALLDELGIAGYPKTTGNRGLHVYVRLEPRWDSYEVRSAAVAVGPRARAAPARPHHRRVVEGGAGRAGLRRLQPERAAQDGVRRVVGAGPARRPGVDPVRMGRARRDPPRRPHHRHVPARLEPSATRGRHERRPAVARAPARDARTRPGQRPHRRPLAARLPEAAGRAAPRRPQPGQEDLTRLSRLRTLRSRDA